jgi:hypothetical protein
MQVKGTNSTGTTSRTEGTIPSMQVQLKNSSSASSEYTPTTLSTSVAGMGRCSCLNT